MRFLIVACTFLLFACSGGADKPSSEDVAHNDSLASTLNSPELKDLNSKLINEPGNADLYHQRAGTYLKLAQLDAAENDSRRAIRLDSTRAEFYLRLVDVFYARNNTRKSKDLLEIIENKFPDNTEALLKLAELYWLVRQYQKGIDYVNKALKIDEHLARGYYIKGGIYRESGDTTRAVSSLVTATEQNNNFTDAFYDLGVLYGARKDPVALQYYGTVLRLDPSHKEAGYARAKLLQDIGKTDEAIIAYKEIIEKDAGCGQCHYNLGAIMLELKNDSRKAVEHFTDAIATDPGFAMAYFARGYAYSKLNDKESARADYKTCLKIEPDFDPAVEGLNALD